MTWSTTSFRVGGGVAFVARHTLALVRVDDESLRRSLWSSMAGDAAIDEILETLMERGLRSLPSFALVRWETERDLRVVVRGDVSVELLVDGARRVIESGLTSTWLEDVVVGVDAVVISLGDDEVVPGAISYDVLAGMVPAAWLSRVAEEIDPHAAEAVDWVVDVQSPEPEPEPEPEPAAPLDMNATLMPSDLEGLALAAPVLAAPVLAAAALDVPVPDEPEQAEDEYDYIFGRTVARSVQRAAVQSVTEEPAASPPTSPSSLPSNLIDGVPSSPVPAPPVLGDHDGRTMTKAQLAALRQASAAPSGPAVQAVRCVAGHPNPTHLTMCRICGAAIAPGPPVMVARPSLGRLRFSNGLEVVLDRPQLIGRNPKLVEKISNELPNLVKLEEFEGLSRRHAAVHLEGWQVLVEDLNSANGTVVALPGRPARRLHAGEPIILEPGAVIDLGGGDVTISYEVDR